MAGTMARSFCERKRRRIGPKSIAMWPERSSWKVVGRRRDCSILIGRTPVSVKPARKRKGQKSTGYYTLPRVVQIQTGDSRSFQEVGAKSKNLKDGVEVAKRYC